MTEPLAGRRILVVEDQMMLARMIEGMLGDLGCTAVHAAATVPQALDLIDAGTFDAAIIDVNLNGTMSYPIADALAVCCVPFFFATGYCGEGIPEIYQDRPVLRKPYRYAQVAEAFAQVLSTPADTAAAR